MKCQIPGTLNHLTVEGEMEQDRENHDHPATDSQEILITISGTDIFHYQTLFVQVVFHT